MIKPRGLRTPMEMQFSSPPDGNLTMNLEPAFSSESFNGRNLQTTLMLSSAAISRSLGVSIAITSGGDGDDGDDDDEGACVCARAFVCIRVYLALDCGIGAADTFHLPLLLLLLHLLLFLGYSPLLPTSLCCDCT